MTHSAFGFKTSRLAISRSDIIAGIFLDKGETDINMKGQ